MSDQSTDPQGTGAASLLSSARSAASGAFDEARARAADVAPRLATAAKAEAFSRAEGAKEGLADQGERLAESLRSAVMGGDDSIQAKLMAAAADSVEDLAGSLRGKSFDQLVADAGGFARRNPGAFVAAAALAGFAVARFARASAPASQAMGGIEGTGLGSAYGSPRHTGTGYASGGMAGGRTGSGSSGDLGSMGYGAGRVAGSGMGGGMGVSTSGLSTHDDDDLGSDMAPDLGRDPLSGSMSDPMADSLPDGDRMGRGDGGRAS